MKRLAKWSLAFLIGLCVLSPQLELNAATTSNVKLNVGVAGQDGQAGTIFGWLDQTYTTSVNSTITTRDLVFWGNQSWTGYDRSGNKITGNTTKQHFQYNNAPVQIMTPGTYYYQITETDSTGATTTSATQSFTVGKPPANTGVSTVNTTGADSQTHGLGFSVSAAGARTARADGDSVIVNANGPMTVHDATTGYTDTENWSMTGTGFWNGMTTDGSPLTANPTWSLSRSSGVHWVAPYTYQELVTAGHNESVIIGYESRCRGYAENPPVLFDHSGGCFNSGSTPYNDPIWGTKWVDPVYTTVHGGNYWASGSWPDPDPDMVYSVSTPGNYTLSETDGNASYGVNLTVDPYRGNIADFTLKNNVIGTTQKLSNLGITCTGDTTGTTETWYLYSQLGTQTFSSLSALNNYAYTVTADLGVTIAHKVVINNQTYISYQTFIVKHAAILPTPSGGYVHVTQILYPVTGQAAPTDVVPVQVKAGGEVTFEVNTIGNVASVVVTYSDGQTQTLKQNTTGVWGGYYYPSSTNTIPVTTPDGTTISITSIKATTTDGVTITASSPLLIVKGTNSSLGGNKYPPKIID